MDAATRQLVRDRADDRCEYCRLPQAVSPFFRFHIEHIQAKQHILDDSVDNLCLACPHCNLQKGPNLTTLDSMTREIIRLVHPRTDVWSDHFVLNGYRINGITPVGKATVELLKMNSEAQLQIRKGLIERDEY